MRPTAYFYWIQLLLNLINLIRLFSNKSYAVKTFLISFNRNDKICFSQNLWLSSTTFSSSFIVLSIPKTMDENSVQKAEKLGRSCWDQPRGQVKRPQMSTGLPAPGLGPELSLASSAEIPFINVNSIYLLKAVTTVKESLKFPWKFRLLFYN